MEQTIEILKAVGFILGILAVCYGWAAFLCWLDPDTSWYNYDEEDF